jgi:hypothetical protein
MIATENHFQINHPEILRHQQKEQVPLRVRVLLAKIAADPGQLR